MRLSRVAVTSVVLGLLSFAAYVAAAPRPVAQPPMASVTADLAAPPPLLRTERHEVREGDTAGSILRAMGAPAAMLTAAGNGLDRLSIGDEILIDWREGDSQPFRLRLHHDPAFTFEIARTGDKYKARQVPVPYVVEEMAAAVTVTSSLWEAATSVGFSPSQVINLAKIFEYDVDFNTELVAGARFRLVLDRLTDDDGQQRVGDIRAAILDNGGKSFTAIRYRSADGEVSWYAADGSARRKAFLRSPIEFSRVTSGFSSGRRHPILGTMRAHKGVDLAAPTGTPIRSVADGVVTKAGWAGGHGNHIEVRHEGGYTTGYSHLSSIGVKRSEKVRQGQLIGRVGSTGMSTGPHLHYEFMVNGVHKDPMKQIVPVTKPLPESEKPAFFALRDQILPQLEDAHEITRDEDAGG
ncbi:MAG: M23 family metallopeptidase [Deltaproteobacteria bacterium]|nr:M23 family metallopeptidase [Deltaproteobacteria bacterium]